MCRKYYDENKNFIFNFTSANEVFLPHQIASKNPVMQEDVDFVIIEDDLIIFLEFKDSTINNADNKEGLDKKLSNTCNDFCKKIAKKFVSSLFLVWACEKNENNCKIKFVFILETPLLDDKQRKFYSNKIRKQLPFKLKDDENVKREIISDFSIITKEQWMNDFPNYSISSVVMD